MKDIFLVTGGARLQGSVKVDGAKNSVLKLMAAALLAEGTTTLHNCPEILDVPLMQNVLQGLGCEVDIDGPTVRITTPAAKSYPRMRILRRSGSSGLQSACLVR